MFFWVVQPSKIILLIENTIPKRKIESYSILGTIVSPNEILLKEFVNIGPERNWGLGFVVVCGEGGESWRFG